VITPRAALLHFRVPYPLRDSQLYLAGGYVVSRTLISPQTLGTLTAEAEAVRPVGKRKVAMQSERAMERGGMPACAFRSASGGERQWAVYGRSILADQLSRLCGVRVTPSGNGSYSYYEQSGDFLALHRDELACDLAVITCIKLKGVPDRSSSGILLVYPTMIDQPLSVVRNSREKESVGVALKQGDTVVLLGGIVPHEVTPVLAGQERIVSLMCYRMPLPTERT
jgi:hypothetical protein